MPRKVKEVFDPNLDPAALAALPFSKFVEAASNGRFKEPLHFAEICEAVEECERLCNSRIVVAAPVQHGKTTILEFAIAWILLRHPDRPIIYVTYGAKKAEKHSRKIRSIFASCGGHLSEDFNTIHQWQTDQGGGLLAVGADGEITGNDAVHIFYDDPYKTRMEAESADYREMVEEKFSSEVVTRIAPSGSIMIVASRWHEDDLSGVKIREGYRNIHLRAIRVEMVVDEDGVEVPTEFALCPWGPDPRYPRTLEFLRGLRDGTDVSEYDWASLYQGEPRPKSAGLFRGVHLYDLDELPAIKRYVLGCDFAYSKTGDRIAIVIMGLGVDDVLYILDVYVWQASVLERLTEVRDTRAGYPAAAMCSYVSGPEMAIIKHLARLNDEEGGAIRVQPMPARESKYLRAGKCARRWNAGKIRVRKSGSWSDEFVRRIVGFTGADGARDDEADALVSGHDLLFLYDTKPIGDGGGFTAGKRVM